MDYSFEEFDGQLKEGSDILLQSFAEDPEVSLEKFSGVYCFLENLTFFSSVLYGFIKDSNDHQKDGPSSE